MFAGEARSLTGRVFQASHISLFIFFRSCSVQGSYLIDNAAKGKHFAAVLVLVVMSSPHLFAFKHSQTASHFLAAATRGQDFEALHSLMLVFLSFFPFPTYLPTYLPSLVVACVLTTIEPK